MPADTQALRSDLSWVVATYKINYWPKFGTVLNHERTNRGFPTSRDVRVFLQFATFGPGETRALFPEGFGVPETRTIIDLWR